MFPSNLVQRPGNVNLLEDLLVLLVLALGLPLTDLLQLLLLVLNVGIDHKVKERPHPQHVGHAPPPEEVRDVGQVLSQELQRARVVVLHGLGDVDDEGLALVVQEVELAEVPVHQAAAVVDAPHRQAKVPVQLARLGRADVNVSEEGKNS